MTKDLTTGKITPLLVRFTLPLVLGNIFQLTYNAVDSSIVGQYVGPEALAAVGVCNPLMTLMILFLNGLCMGAGILIGTQYGAKDFATMKRQISTTMLAGVAFSGALMLVCVVLARPILHLLRVDPSIMDMAVIYMRVVFTGLVFTYLYNFFSSVLRALGDAKSPLYFLIISAVINVLGDLFFVVVLHWGSMGCALATVISEALSAAFCLAYIQRKIPVLRLGRAWFEFDRSLLKKTVSYGWASAMQQSTVQLGKIVVTAIVNTMGVSVAAAFAAVNRIDDFAYIPQQNIGHAMTALMAQNRGAGRKDRMWQGFRAGMLLECAYGVIVFLACFLLAEPLMKLFVRDTEVIGHGVRYLHIISIMYIMPALTNGIQGFFRGIGDLKVTLLSSMVNMGVRVLFAFPMVIWLGVGIEALPYSYAAGWVGMLVVELPLLVRQYRAHRQETTAGG